MQRVHSGQPQSSVIIQKSLPQSSKPKYPAKSKSESNVYMKKCPRCNTLVREDRLSKHMRKVHSSQQPQSSRHPQSSVAIKGLGISAVERLKRIGGEWDVVVEPRDTN
jgi:hypothetical protein